MKIRYKFDRDGNLFFSSDSHEGMQFIIENRNNKSEGELFSAMKKLIDSGIELERGE